MDNNLSRRFFLSRGARALAALGLAGGALESLLLPNPAAANFSSNWPESPPTGSSATDTLAADSPAIYSPATGQQPPPLNQCDPDEFVFSRFKYSNTSAVSEAWDCWPQGDENFLAYLRQATNIKVSAKSYEERKVHVEDLDEFYGAPLLFMTGEGDFTLSQSEASALAEHFKRGGFLYGDDCVTNPIGDHFYRAFVREMPKVFGHALEPVPADNEIYHCFYDIPGGCAPFCQGTRHPDMGLMHQGRMVAFLTCGDVHCGWWSTRPTWPPERKEECMRMGTNIVIYALTH